MNEAICSRPAMPAAACGDRLLYFLAVMSRVMRHVLVDYARAQSAAKRGGVKPLSLHDHHAASVEDPAA
ncbi:MAG: ECF-type sigma factor [Bryobacterales bacterium]|nr:ECF-type sigma factor [Bryobacterales bacterium]